MVSVVGIIAKGGKKFYPEFWLYFLGALFIGVTLFLPNGVMGLAARLGSKQKQSGSKGEKA